MWWITTTLDNTAAHNAARTCRKQQLLSSFSQIKIHPFFWTKTSTLHTELARISHVFSVLVVTMTSVPFSTQSFFQTRTFLIRVMADGLSAKLQGYLSDFSLEFWLTIWHNYYLGDVVGYLERLEKVYFRRSSTLNFVFLNETSFPKIGCMFLLGGWWCACQEDTS